MTQVPITLIALLFGAVLAALIYLPVNRLYVLVYAMALAAALLVSQDARQGVIDSVRAIPSDCSYVFSRAAAAIDKVTRQWENATR
jgi:Na+/citrate or Na+/malate symporter